MNRLYKMLRCIRELTILSTEDRSKQILPTASAANKICGACLSFSNNGELTQPPMLREAPFVEGQRLSARTQQTKWYLRPTRGDQET